MTKAEDLRAAIERRGGDTQNTNWSKQELEDHLKTLPPEPAPEPRGRRKAADDGEKKRKGEDVDPALAKNEGVYQAKEDGALYDDMVPDGKVTYRDGTKKPELSQTMRDKLINEGRALGADPNQKNPFLYVFAAVGLFVLAGAATFTG